MKKCFKALIYIFILVSIGVFFISNLENRNEDNAVEIWWYEYEGEYLYNRLISRFVDVLVYNSFALHGITVKEMKYSYKDMTYDDYVFKRNIALSTKNALTIDDTKNLYSLRNYHDDYNKVENYAEDNFVDMFKGKYCIPMGVYSQCVLINKDIFDYYNIEISSNKLYTYSEFLDLRQRLKEEGARFSLNRQDYYYTIDYYIDKNRLNSSDLFDSFDMGEDKFRQALKKTILEIYNDFSSYYDNKINFNTLLGNDYEQSVEFNENKIYDTTSSQVLMSTRVVHPFYDSDYNRATEDFSNKIPVLLDSYYTRNTLKSPSIFIYNKDHDENLYKIASELLTDTYFGILLPSNNYGGKHIYYIPTHISQFVYKAYGFDENFMNNSYMANLAKIGQKNLEAQLNLSNVVRTNIMNDAIVGKQIMNSFSRGGSIDYLYNFIIEELMKINEDEKNIEKLDKNIYDYTRNYYIRIK